MMLFRVTWPRAARSVATISPSPSRRDLQLIRRVHVGQAILRCVARAGDRDECPQIAFGPQANRPPVQAGEVTGEAQLLAGERRFGRCPARRRAAATSPSGGCAARPHWRRWPGAGRGGCPGLAPWPWPATRNARTSGIRAELRAASRAPYAGRMSMLCWSKLPGLVKVDRRRRRSGACRPRWTGRRSADRRCTSRDTALDRDLKVGL